MNGNNSRDIITRKYEKLLTCFGRKVLTALIQHCSSGGSTDYQLNRSNYANRYENSRPHQSKRPVEYVNSNGLHSHPNNEGEFSNSPHIYANNAFPNIDNEVDFIDVNAVLTELNIQTIPKSVELVKSADDVTVPLNLQNNTRLNVIDDSLNTDTIPSASSLLNALNDKNDVLKKHPTENSNTINFTEQVAWEDMFDSELFPKKDHHENLSGNKLEKTLKVVKTFEIKFPEKLQKDNNGKQYSCESDKNKKKHKNQSGIADVIPKKVKKVAKDFDKIPKPNLRKQKYTKTVKNWLSDIDSTHSVENVEKQNDIIIKNVTRENKIQITFGNTIDENNIKRTIQAQLSNENGVMKYCKPTDKNELCNKFEQRDSTTTESNKDKKVKSKFVAPIKSQIPVKDITYKVISLDNDSLDENIDKLRFENEEIVMTLIYSNGYCQLNYYHTEESGVSQGIIFLVDDQFYYLKGFSIKYKEILQSLIDNNSVICYEGKNVLAYLYHHLGWTVSRSNLKILDAKVGGSLLDPDNPPNKFSELQKLLTYVPQYTVATECCLQKSAWYISLLKDCWDRLRQSLDEQGLWNIFVEIEMRVLPIIADMEYRGISVDIDKLKYMDKLLQEKMKNVEQDCYMAAGKTFQINSAAQVRTILYDELKLDSKCNVKIRETICKGAKSTSETMLRSLINKHPLPKSILEYRHLHKAHSTFISGIAQCVREGVIKPVWEQTAASTGRIACNSPNLQAVPKTPFSLTLFPKEGTGGGKGLKKPEAEITGEERERTKRVVYANMYGAGANKLAEVLGLGYEHALTVAASFNRTFPSLKSFGRAVVSRCERDGKLRTPCGRTRHFKDIGSSDFATKAQAERKAVNFIVQGNKMILNRNSHSQQQK